MHLRRRTAGAAGRRTSHSIAGDSVRGRALASVPGLLSSCGRRRRRIAPQKRGAAAVRAARGSPEQHKRTLNTRPTPAFDSGAWCGRTPAAAPLLSALILRTGPLAPSQGRPPAQRPTLRPGPVCTRGCSGAGTHVRGCGGAWRRCASRCPGIFLPAVAAREHRRPCSWSLLPAVPAPSPPPALSLDTLSTQLPGYQELYPGLLSWYKGVLLQKTAHRRALQRGDDGR